MRGIVQSAKEQWKVILTSIVVTLIITFGTTGVERFLSSNTFCLSCHSMRYPYEELKESPHYGDVGRDPECQDCHLPPQFLNRVQSHIIDGTRAVIGMLQYNLNSKDEFDKHRAEFAHNARINLKRWDSSPCRVCHKNPRPSSEEGERQHKKIETERDLTCIDCHQNIVHKAVPQEDLARGMAEGRIVLKDKK